MAESSINIIFCYDITKVNELLTGPVSEYISYFRHKLDIVEVA